MQRGRAATWSGWVVVGAICVTSALSAQAADKSASEEIAERLAGAIRFETVSYENAEDFAPAPFRGLADYLRILYPRTHKALTLETVNDHTLLFRWDGSDATLAPALFMSHLDVVPVEEAALEAWTHPPYAGVIQDGYVWGRGAIDVKSGVILWLEAIESLLAEGFVPRRSVYLSLGHDEEIGGYAGAAEVARLFRDRGIRPAFLFDEGGFILDGHPLLPDVTTALVVLAEKAFYTVELTARGVSGHSSIPPRNTAIGKLARAIYRVEENPMPARLVEPVREMFVAAAPHTGFVERLAFRNLWLMGGTVTRRMLGDPINAALVRTTFATTVISGGVKSNVIPEFARATINVRILPGDTQDDVLAHLAEVIDDPEVEIVGISWGLAADPASVSGLAFPLAKAAVLAVLPDAVVLPGMVPGATDSRHFAGQVDEIVRFVPTRLHMDLSSGAHGRDERIAIEHLAESAAIAVGMLRRAGTPAP